MRVTLLGTGSADGWPNPWCDCASCSWARGHEVRGQTAVLVDDALLIDCGPDVPRTAARLGVRLSGLRHLLVSHAHPDHLAPESLMWRSWSTVASQRLDVVGPPAALAACREFLSRWERSDPDRDGSPLRLIEVVADGAPTAGEPLRLGGPAWPLTDRTGSDERATRDAGTPRPGGDASSDQEPVPVREPTDPRVVPDKAYSPDPEYVVRPVAARHGDASVGPAVLYDVTAPDGGRLLYGCDTAAPLPPETLAAVSDRAYDVVLLEENNGDRPGFGEHLDLDTFSQLVAELRRRRAVVAGTLVLAVHLSHRNPPGDELARRLALAGAHAPSDGAVYDIVPAARQPARPVEPPRPARRDGPSRGPDSTPGAPASRTLGPEPAYRVLITGGARSGKSAEAERRLLAEPEVVYVATSAPPDPDDTEWADAEWAERIAAHRRRRPAAWTTVETVDLVPLLDSAGPPLLIDGLGLWVAAWLDDPAVLRSRMADLVDAWRATPRRVVAVTDEVGSGVVPASEAGRRFRDALGRLNADLAAESDEVWQVVAGLPLRLRPQPVPATARTSRSAAGPWGPRPEGATSDPPHGTRS